MKTPVFYDHFERHAGGQGVKGHSTHYCPGCGHGIVHRDLATAIGDLDLQDRTVLISPVGCAVFAHYYFDVGNSQAAHGRAPAVALGHKLANPQAIVVCYQGDGDLASIGLAETISIAQMGVPLTVIFVNNAVYGMTGGQCAPTSLPGQKTTTTPEGRDRITGQPLRMAELIAGLDGPIYVERVALFDPKQRLRARRAMAKALRLQAEGRGYAFIEVLAECPTHLKLTPELAEAWVRDQMVPAFPLGLKKDLTTEPWFSPRAPNFEAEDMLALAGAEPITAAADPTTPRAHGEAPGTAGLALKFAGSGGDGAQTAAMLVARAAIAAGLDATHIPSYGPESRGGTSYADVRLAATEVLNPAAPEPDVLVAFNALSLAKFATTVRPGGTILYDATAVPAPGALPDGRRVLAVPFTAIARDLGRPVAKNMVALGALQAATQVLPAEHFVGMLHTLLKDKPALWDVNEKAFAAGQAAVVRQPSFGIC